MREKGAHGTQAREDKPRWPARLSLAFEASAARTVLRRRGGSGPLYVQRPFYPEGGVCHCYLLHPPGGVAGGDDLATQLTLEENSDVLLTTPAATKFYRSAGSASRIEQQLVLKRGARGEWLPQENLLFPGAVAELSLQLSLAPEARMLAGEVFGLGRPHAGEPFNAGSVRQRVKITLGERPLLSEQLVFRAGDPLLAAPWGLAGRTAYGALYAYPGDVELVRWLRRQLAAHGTSPPHSDGSRERSEWDMLAVTCVDGLVVVRGRHHRLDYLKAQLERCWSLLREPVLGRPAQRPRIWNT